MRTLDEGLRLKQQLIEEGVLLWREKQVKKILVEVPAIIQHVFENHPKSRSVRVHTGTKSSSKHGLYVRRKLGELL